MSSRRRGPSSGPSKLTAAISLGGVILIVGAAFGGGVWLWGHTSVDEGYEVVVKEKGQSKAALTPGTWYWHNPLTHGYERINMRPQLMTMLGPDAIQVKNADQLNVPVDVAVTYEVTDSVAFHEEWRNHEYARKILIRNPARDVVYTVGGNMSTEAMTSDEGRLAMKAAVRDRLNERFSGEPVELLTVEMRDVRPPKSYMDERRKIKEEEQRVEQADLRAQQRVKDAEGEAEANRIVSESLDDNLLDYRQMQAMENGTAIYIPVSQESGLPTYLDATRPDDGQGGNSNSTNAGGNSNNSGDRDARPIGVSAP